VFFSCISQVLEEKYSKSIKSSSSKSGKEAEEEAKGINLPCRL